MPTLGACLISHDIPYEGMAKEIIERRIQGQSWKQIGEDLGIGSPGAARAKFTKLTGLTDYKVKGSDLLKLVKDGVPDGGPLPSAVAKVPKAPATPVKELSALERRIAIEKIAKLLPEDSFGSLNPGWPDLTPYQRSLLMQVHKGAKLTVKQVTTLSPEEIVSMYKKLGFKNDIPLPLKAFDKTPDVVQPAAKKIATKAEIPDVTADPKKYKFEVRWVDFPSVDDIDKDDLIGIRALHDKGTGYQAIKSKYPKYSVEDIDRIVANHELFKSGGDPYLALKGKPNSLLLQKTLSDKVFDAVQKGLTPEDILKAISVPKRLTNEIVEANGKWKLPFGKKLPTDPEPMQLPSYQAHLANAKAPKDVDPGNVPFGLGTGRGEVDPTSYPKATNGQLQAMRYRKWSAAVRDPAAESAISRYTGSSYRTINGNLRKGHVSTTTRATIKAMDAGMYEVDEAFSVTRGMGVDGFGMGSLGPDHIRELIGKVFTDQGFLSTSTKPIFGGGGVRLNIEVPVGARGHWAKPISNISSEDEFILARGTKLMIMGIEEKESGFGTKTWVVRARVII